jgi:hypothetical protein
MVAKFYRKLVSVQLFKRLLRRIFPPMRDEISEGRRSLHDEKICCLYTLHSTDALDNLEEFKFRGRGMDVK